MLRYVSARSLAVRCICQAWRLGRLWVLGAVVVLFAPAVGVTGLAAAAGLPDGRVYEQASAVKKNGNEAGVGLVPFGGEVLAVPGYGTAAAGGGAVAYT